MEAGAVHKMVDSGLHHLCFIINIIVSDDVSTIKAVRNHPSRGAQDKVIKSSKGNLNEEIPVSSSLEDPSHHVNFIFANHFFAIVKYFQ